MTLTKDDRFDTVATVPEIAPRAVPELRSLLREEWEPNGLFCLTESNLQGIGLEDAAHNGRLHSAHLANASLIWVSSEMLNVLMHAARSVPDDVMATDVPLTLGECGLVVFESTWSALDARENVRLPVQAISWATTNITNVENNEHGRAFYFNSYTSHIPRAWLQEWADERGIDLTRANMKATWLYSGSSMWNHARQIDAVPAERSEAARASIIEDRRFLCALMTILAHEGIANTEQLHPDRAARRRAERSGHDPANDTVSVVTLRRLRSASEPGEPDAESRYDHRWMVSGHWRRQPYGPKHELRRLQWINPYVKGPEDGELVLRDVVHAWRR